MLCISPRMVMSWMTQWSFQRQPTFGFSTPSLMSSNSTMGTGFLGFLRFLATFTGVDTHSSGPLFPDVVVKSMGAVPASDDWSNSHSKNWRHVRWWEKERQLAPNSWNTWEERHVRKGWTLCTRIGYCNRWVAASRGIRTANAHFSWIPLRMHDAR